MLECGLPRLNYLENDVQKLSKNENATIDVCMIQAGFHYEGRSGWCENFKEKNLPICQPDAVIPQRSVEKRLNNLFCKRCKMRINAYLKLAAGDDRQSSILVFA
ncbi:hypothetical protein [Bartonella birtlesii]|uniref:Uncharacterized protein n=1 Tax=Bartonella birtlesii LL-WM9 TaxID=1094552 RepID=J1IYY1_9HYPH|nr:hypothetical protein ME7_00652 [Bartonella birtlesii LL-WM9]